MNCEEVRRRLAEGDELVSGAAEIQGHLDGCEDCQALVRRLAEVDEALDALPGVEPPPESVKRVVAAVREDVRRPKRRDWRPVYAIGAAAAVGVVVFAFLLPMADKSAGYEMSIDQRTAQLEKAEDRYAEVAALEESNKKPGAGKQGGRWRYEVRSIDTLDTDEAQGDDKWKANNPFCPTCAPPQPVGATALPSAGEAMPEGSEASGYYYQRLDESGAEIADGKDIDADGEGDDGRAEHGWWEGRRGPAPARPAQEPATVPPTKTPAPDPDSTRSIDRSEVDSNLDNINKVATDARIVPHIKNGRTDGFKICSIRKGSVYDQAGLRNGDVVRKVNGHSVDAPEKALEIYQKLQGTNRVELDVERKGRGETIVLEIDDAEDDDKSRKDTGDESVDRGLVAGNTSVELESDDISGDLLAPVATAGPAPTPKLAYPSGPATATSAPVTRKPADSKRQNLGKSAQGQQRGQLKIGNGPSGAKIYLDGQPVQGGQRIDLPPGEYRVELQKPGYATQEQTVEVPSGKLVILQPPADLPPSSGTTDSSVATSTFGGDGAAPAGRDEQRREAARARAVEDPAATDIDEDIAPVQKTSSKRGKGGKKRYKEQPVPPPLEPRPRGAPLPDTLDKKTVLTVIKRGLPKIKKCGQEQVSRDKSKVVKQIVLAFTIERNGRCTGISVGPDKIKGSYLESCVKKTVASWRYPKFDGENIKIKLPLPLPVAAHGGSGTSPASPAPADLERERQSLDSLEFIPAEGYFANTYLPGDPTTAWLRRSLEDRLFFGERMLTLDHAAQPYAQPFDAPASDGLAVFLGADHAAIEGPTRLTLQVGLKGSLRHARRRAPLNAALVVDLRELPDDADRRILWSLADALAADLSAGDRFSLLVAGAGEPLQLRAGRFSAAEVRRALARAFEARESAGDADDLAQALDAAFDAVSGAPSQDAALGASLVVLASAASCARITPTLETLAHRRAVEGTTLTAIGAGADADADGLARLAQAGQGRRRLVADRSRAARVLGEELAASGRVVARAVRLRIRLAEGVKLVEVLGSKPLSQRRVVRVKAAELAIDRKVSSTLGITADRGEDESGIQIVIPAYYAGDDHVILLDVVADGPGPLADVRVRYKDLVNLRNNAARASLALPAGERPAGPLARNVQKNLLAHRIAESLAAVSQRIARGDLYQASIALADAQARVARFQARSASLLDDPELNRDLSMLAEYASVLDHPEVVAADPVVRGYLMRSLSLAGRIKLPPGDRG